MTTSPSITLYSVVGKDIWHQDVMRNLSMGERDALMHLWTGPAADQLGIYTATVEELAASRNVAPHEQREHMRGLAEKGLIAYDRAHVVVVYPMIEDMRPGNLEKLRSLLRRWYSLPLSPAAEQGRQFIRRVYNTCCSSGDKRRAVEDVLSDEAVAAANHGPRRLCTGQLDLEEPVPTTEASADALTDRAGHAHASSAALSESRWSPLDIPIAESGEACAPDEHSRDAGPSHCERTAVRECGTSAATMAAADEMVQGIDGQPCESGAGRIEVLNGGEEVYRRTGDPSDGYSTDPVKMYRGGVLRGAAAARFRCFWAHFQKKESRAKAAYRWSELERDHGPEGVDAVSMQRVVAAAQTEAQRREMRAERGLTPKWPDGWLHERRCFDEALVDGSALVEERRILAAHHARVERGERAQAARSGSRTERHSSDVRAHNDAIRAEIARRQGGVTYEHPTTSAGGRDG